MKKTCYKTAIEIDTRGHRQLFVLGNQNLKIFDSSPINFRETTLSYLKISIFS